MIFFAFLLCIASLAGIGFILYKKAPQLRRLSYRPGSGRARDFILRSPRAVGKSRVVKAVQGKVVRGVLASAHAVAAKTERRVGDLLEKTHERSGEKRAEFVESYGNRLRRSVPTRKRRQPAAQRIRASRVKVDDPA